MPTTITEHPCDPRPNAPADPCSYACPDGTTGMLGCRTVDDGNFTATCAVVCEPGRPPIVVSEPEGWMAFAAIGMLYAIPHFWRSCARAMERP